MPGKLRKVKGGYKWEGGKRVHKTKAAAHRAKSYDKRRK